MLSGIYIRLTYSNRFQCGCVYIKGIAPLWASEDILVMSDQPHVSGNAESERRDVTISDDLDEYDKGLNERLEACIQSSRGLLQILGDRRGRSLLSFVPQVVNTTPVPTNLHRPADNAPAQSFFRGLPRQRVEADLGPAPAFVTGFQVATSATESPAPAPERPAQAEQAQVPATERPAQAEKPPARAPERPAQAEKPLAPALEPTALVPPACAQPNPFSDLPKQSCHVDDEIQEFEPCPHTGWGFVENGVEVSVQTPFLCNEISSETGDLMTISEMRYYNREILREMMEAISRENPSTSGVAWGDRRDKFVESDLQVREGIFQPKHVPEIVVYGPTWEDLRRLYKFHYAEKHNNTEPSFFTPGGEKKNYDDKKINAFMKQFLDQLMPARKRDSPSDRRYEVMFEPPEIGNRSDESQTLISARYGRVHRYGGDHFGESRSVLVILQELFDFPALDDGTPEHERRKENHKKMVKGGVKVLGYEAGDSGGIAGRVCKDALERALKKGVELGSIHLEKITGKSPGVFDDVFYINLPMFSNKEDPDKLHERFENLRTIVIIIIWCISSKLKLVPFMIDPLFFAPMFIRRDDFDIKHFARLILPHRFSGTLPYTSIVEFINSMSEPASTESIPYKETNIHAMGGLISAVNFNCATSLRKPGDQSDIFISDPDATSNGDKVLNLNYLGWYLRELCQKGLPYVNEIWKHIYAFYESAEIDANSNMNFLTRKIFNFERETFTNRDASLVAAVDPLIFFCATNDPVLMGNLNMSHLDFLPVIYKALCVPEVNRNGLEVQTSTHIGIEHVPNVQEHVAMSIFHEKRSFCARNIIFGLPNSANHAEDPPRIDHEYFVLLKNRFIPTFKRSDLFSDGDYLARIEKLMGIYDVIPAQDSFTNVLSKSPALEHALRRKREKLLAVVELMNKLIESAQRSESDTSAAVHEISSWSADMLFRRTNALSGEVTEIGVFELRDQGILENLNTWINKNKPFASKEYAKYLQKFIEDTTIPANETLDIFNEKLKKRKNIGLLFPERQFNCPVTGPGKLCPTCSFSRCNECCFKENSCDECILNTERFEASNFLDVVTGGQPCTSEHKINIYITNQTAKSNFVNGKVLGGKGDKKSPTLPHVVACTTTLYIGPQGESYFKDRVDNNDLADMQFSTDNINGCMQHALFGLLRLQTPGQYDERLVYHR